jgi:23S rRNA pseudouridine1911/1915/1917 synthase
MSDDSLVIVVEADEAGRADHIVGLRFPDASRKRLASLFAEGLVRVDGKKAKKGHVVRAGQTIRLERAPDSAQDMHPLPTEGALVVVHEDSDLLVLSKPAGMPTHPLRAGEVGTLANLLVHVYPECVGVGEDPREAGLAHRLDIDTSGLLIAARNAETWDKLRRAFAEGAVKKSYLAVVHDRPIGVECEEPLLQQGKRVQVDYAGLDAHTSWTEIERNQSFALLRCQAHTGRMHQVRAHLAHCGSSIVGDTLYGGEVQEGFAGHFLHAAELSLAHPRTGEPLSLQAPLPEDRALWLQGQGLSLAGPS